MHERLDVGTAEQRRVVPVVVAGTVQALRQHGQAVQVVPQRAGGDLAATARQVISGPPLSGLPQPALPDRGEGELAGLPEHHQVPHVLADLGFRVQERRRGMPGQAADQPVLHAGPAGELVQPASPGPPQLPGNLAQLRRAGDGPDPGALLQSVEQLGNSAVGDPAETDLARLLDRRLDGPPRRLVEGRACPQLAGTLVMRTAVPPLPPVPAARPHLAQIAGCQRHQPRTRAGSPFTSGRAVAIAGVLSGAGTPARSAFLVTAIERVAASGNRASPPAQQRMAARQREHPRHVVPSGPGEERRSGQVRQPPRGITSIPPGTRHPGATRRGHHGFPPARRGLGTRATAARNRAGSGCR